MKRKVGKEARRQSSAESRQSKDAKEKLMHSLRRVAIPRASAVEIQRKLIETMLAVLEGRMTPEEGFAISMVAEEQMRMLEEEESRESGGKARGGRKRWVN